MKKRIPIFESIKLRNFIPDTAKCFSCMSKFYEAVWPALSTVYKRPLNFTDQCNEEFLDPRLVPVTHCSTMYSAVSFYPPL